MACLREWLDCTFFDVTAEFSGSRNFAPPPQSHATERDAVPAQEIGLPQRLRAALAAVRQPGPGPAPEPPTHAQDRISLVARATSPAERLTKRVKAEGLPPLSAGPAMPANALAAFADAVSSYRGARPWETIRPDRTIQLSCPGYSQQPVFLAVFGDRTADAGLAIFFMRPGLSLTLQGALLGGMITWPPFLAALLPGGAHGSPDAEAVFNTGHGYPQAGRSLRRPLVKELSLLESCLRAVPGFVRRYAAETAATEQVSVATAAGTLELTLAWLVEGEREL